MKKHLFSLTILFIFSYGTFAQKGITWEEYKYITKGYPQKDNLGLDMKDGYYVKKDVKGHLTTDYIFEFENFYRSADDSFVGTYLKISSTYKDETYHLCMPAINLTLQDQSHDILKDFLDQVDNMKNKLEDEIYRYMLRYFIIYQTAIQNRAGLEGLEAIEKLVENEGGSGR